MGALCELTHLVRADQPGQPLLLVNARVVGRFLTTDVLCSEPFVTGALGCCWELAASTGLGTSLTTNVLCSEKCATGGQ